MWHIVIDLESMDLAEKTEWYRGQVFGALMTSQLVWYLKCVILGRCGL